MNFVTMEHRDTIKDLCTDQSSIAMPNIPINENGDYEYVTDTETNHTETNRSTNSATRSTRHVILDGSESERSSVTPNGMSEDLSGTATIPEHVAHRPKDVTLNITGGTAFLKFVNFEKRNKANDDIFYCSYIAEKCKGILCPVNPEDVLDESKPHYQVKCNKCSQNAGYRYRFVCKICHLLYSGDEGVTCNHNSKGKVLCDILNFINSFHSLTFFPEMTKFTTEMYSCDMSGIGIHSFIDGLVSEENSPFLSLLKSTPVYDLGCSGVITNARVKQKMGLKNGLSTSVSLLARRIESLEYVQSVRIHLKNVAPVEGVAASKIVEEHLHKTMSHKHYGICLAVPKNFGLGMKVVVDEFGNEEMILYLVGAIPLNNFFFKKDLRKGRRGKEKETALFIETQQTRLLEQIAQQGEDIRELMNSNAELQNSNAEMKNILGFVASKYGYGGIGDNND